MNNLLCKCCIYSILQNRNNLNSFLLVLKGGVGVKVKKVILKNFHGFVERESEYSDQFTVLIGENATGKTAVLDGLAVAIGGFLNGIDGVNSRNIYADEVRIEKYEQGGIITIEPQFDSEVICTANIDHKEYRWKRALRKKNGKTTRKDAMSIIKYAAGLQEKVRKGEEVTLPVIAYHGTGRLWAQTNDTEDELFETGSRFVGYKNCLNPISNEKLFLKWFKKMTLIEIQRAKEIRQFKAVKDAMEKCIEGLVDPEDKKNEIKVQYDISAEELQISLEDGKLLPFHLLSDGYRNVLGMVADIAFRMAVLNPFLQDKSILETTGIVLIDELDLHLHPKWQRKIVDDLKRTFPGVQFIATTHSPFIIQSLETGELRVLDEEN
jgi:predicted ATP-binding protein involved in virulence